MKRNFYIMYGCIYVVLVYSFQKCQKIEKKKQIFLGKYTKTTDILLSWIKLCTSSLYFYLSHRFMGVIPNYFL